MKTEFRLLKECLAQVSRAMDFIREHYLLVDGVPQEYIDASFGRKPRRQKADRDGEGDREKGAPNHPNREA